MKTEKRASPAVPALLCAALVSMLAAVSCGPRDTDQDSDVSPEADLELDPYADGPLELPEYEGDPFAGFGPVTRLEVHGGGEAELPPDEALTEELIGPVDPGESSAADAGGFSVQIAACETREGADRMAALVAHQTEEPVFVDSVPPYWKVRIGSFESHSDAEAFLPTARDMGYGDAWVVERSDGGH